MWRGEGVLVMVAVEIVVEWAVPLSCVVHKNWEGYLDSEQSQPQVTLGSLLRLGQGVAVLEK